MVSQGTVKLQGDGQRLRGWPPLERLMYRIVPVPESGCWLWTGAVNRSGYGISEKAYGEILVHRAMYRGVVGEIPDGLCVCHKCDVRSCANPDHLFLGTNADNVADKVRKGRAIGQARDDNPNSKVSEEDIAVMLRTSGTVASIARAARIAEGSAWRIIKQYGGRSPHALLRADR